MVPIKVAPLSPAAGSVAEVRQRFPWLRPEEAQGLLNDVNERMQADCRNLTRLSHSLDAANVDAACFEQIRFIAHRLCGLCAVLGLSELADLAARSGETVTITQKAGFGPAERLAVHARVTRLIVGLRGGLECD